MSCTPDTPLLVALRAAVGDRVFTVVSEWQGYLPYGQYCWIEVDGVDVTGQLPTWDSSDIARLAADGHLIELERWATSDDGMDTRTTYRVR